MEILFNPLFITLGSCGLIFIVMGFIMSKKTTKGDQWPVWLPNTKSYEKSKKLGLCTSV